MTLRDFLDRYGVTLTVVGLLAIVLAVLPGNAPNEVASQLGSIPGEGGSGTAPGGAGGLGNDGAGIGAGGPAAAGRGAAGGVGPGGLGPGAGTGKASVVFGKGDCRPDGREASANLYSPPCALWTGSNGGATSRGVFPDKVVVVRYIGQVNPATKAILEANKLADSEETRKKAFEALRRYLNQHTVTYGREVKIVELPASGEPTNDRAARADAVKIAEDIKAFAVFDGTPDATIPKVLAQEVARRGVICICTVLYTKEFYLENPPYIFGAGLPTSTEHAIQIGEFVGKRMAGRKAQWAGDEFYPAQQYKSKVRKFGFLYYTGQFGQVERDFQRYRDTQIAELKKHGVTLCKDCVQGYLYDPGRNQNDMSTIIAKFKGAGVTTLIMAADPLSPILITQEATNQTWFPEWFITGWGLSDTTTAGRLYDQKQWGHAFGISPLWVTWEHVNGSYGWRMAHHGDASLGDGEEGVLINIYAAEISPVFWGIHLAGPNLTPNTFSQGLLRFPQTGGIPGAPLVYFTREAPTLIKDFTEVWFDDDRRGPDERGEQGLGMMVKPNNGQRYKPGQWPRTAPEAFVEKGKEATVSDNPPGGGIGQPHEEDGHRHQGACKTCSGFKTTR